MTASDDKKFGDDRLLRLYLDGELQAAAAADFAARTLSDSGLRERVEAAEADRDALRAGFVAASAISAPAGFTAKVMAEVRRLPSRDQMQHQDILDGALRLCRRALLAAAVLCGLGLAWQVGLLDRDRAGTLQAAPDEIQREMDRLDALIRLGVASGDEVSDGAGRAADRSAERQNGGRAGEPRGGK